MVPPEEIEAEQPATLPADFSEWDSGEYAAVQASRVNGSDAALRATAVSSVRATPRIPEAPATIQQAHVSMSTSALITANAEAEELFKPVRSKDGNPEGLEDRDLGKGGRKVRMALFAVGLLLLILIALGYFKLRSRADMARQPTVSKPAPPNLPQTGAMNLPAAPQLPKPAAGNAPTLTPAAAKPQQVALGAQSEVMSEQLTAPSRIPSDLGGGAEKGTPPSAGFGSVGVENLGGSSGSMAGSVFGKPAVLSEKKVVLGKVRLSAGVAGGLLLQKTPPVYPSIARTAHVAGTVVIQATISKAGLIESPHIVSGPIMLRQAALDAVRNWRYRPYLLNGEPAEVETTVNIVFTLDD
jgi:protein TonB